MGKNRNFFPRLQNILYLHSFPCLLLSHFWSLFILQSTSPDILIISITCSLRIITRSSPVQQYGDIHYTATCSSSSTVFRDIAVAIEEAAHRRWSSGAPEHRPSPKRSRNGKEENPRHGTLDAHTGREGTSKNRGQVRGVKT